MRSLWRISNHCDLQGVGGEKSDGRWHTAERGKRIVYLSDHPALALIEVLANLTGNPLFFPEAYQLMKITVADQVAIDELKLDRLSANWRDEGDQTRSMGDSWLGGAESGLLAVPSVPSPESVNYLFNPLHPDAQRVEIEWCKRIKYYRRLFHIPDTN